MPELFKNTNRRKDTFNQGGVSGGEIQSDNLSRVIPRQIDTGTMRGTQNVGYGNTKIDGSNNTITVGDSILLDGNNSVISIKNSDGSYIGMGLIPNTNSFGFYSMDSNGNVIMTIIDGLLTMNDPSTSQKRVFVGKSLGGF